MKVLLINQVPEMNNKYTFSLARALMRQEVDMYVCGFEDDHVSAYRDVPYLNFFYNYSKEKGGIHKVLSYRKSWKRILSYCKKENINLVHVQWYIFSPLDWIYQQKLRKMGIKVVVTIHDLLPFNKKFYDFHYHKLIYSHADMVISQARMNKERLLTEFGVREKKITYIPHGHYMEYAEPASQEESRIKLGLPANKQIILFFGQIKKVKGVDVLIKAMRKVVDTHQDVLCLIAGKVWKDDFSAYQSLIDTFDLKDYIRTDIRFIDDQEIKYYFNASDIIALPYLQIYQSGVILLAYSYEKPVVATREGEFLTVVKDHETGLLVESGDPIALSKAICWYLDNMETAKEYGRLGKKDLMVRLSWDTIATKLKKVYLDIL